MKKPSFKNKQDSFLLVVLSLFILSGILAITHQAQDPVGYARGFDKFADHRHYDDFVKQRNFRHEHPASFLDCLGQQTYYVETGKKKGTGTIDKPFGTLSEALGVAEKQNLCLVKLKVKPGYYNEKHLIITQDTLIENTSKNIYDVAIEGTFKNQTGSLLSIQDITLANAPYPGAIFVKNGQAKTVLDNVIVNKAKGCAIRQMGGELSISHAQIMSTQSFYKLPGDGSGLCVHEVTTDLNDVNFLYNSNHGLYQSSGKTFATEVNVKNTDCIWKLMKDSDWTSYCSGILTFNQAEFYGQELEVLNSKWAGAIFYDSTLHLKDFVIASTTDNPPKNNGGGNLAIKNSQAELHEFEIFNGSVGLFHMGSCIRMSNGTITDHSLGIYHTGDVEECQVDLCSDNIDKAGNDQDIETNGNYAIANQALAVPCPPNEPDCNDDKEEEPEEPQLTCAASVPWPS